MSRSAYWTYGLAYLGAHLAFMPLLVMILPRQVEALAPGDPARLLSWLLLTGGLVAGLANIAAGAVSDRWFERHGDRRGLIAIGTALLAMSYVGFALVEDAPSLFAALVFFQVALNCSFAPLGALLSDHVPDRHKGRMGGLMNAALPASTLLVAPIAWLFPAHDPRAFLLVGGLSGAAILPLLVTWKFEHVFASSPSTGVKGAPPRQNILPDFAKAWLSRLLIQTGAAFVIGFIYLFIAASDRTGSGWADFEPSTILAILTVPSAALAILTTILGGHVSDRLATRRIPLAICALVTGAGLAMLATQPQPTAFMIGYGLFQIGLAGYLSIDTAMVAQLVSRHPQRGLLLGVMNLSNTLPAVIAPSLALLAFANEELARELGGIFAVFAVGAVLAGGLILLIRNVR